MTLYEIDEALTAAYENAVDPETGEIDEAWMERINALEMDREKKLEGVALWIKDLNAEAEAIRNEEKALAERRRAATNKAERLKGYLIYALAGAKFKTARASVSYTHSKSVELDDPELVPAEFWNMPDPVLNKVAIKAAFKNGEIVDGVHLEESESIVIR